jgi:hypothetical protein
MTLPCFTHQRKVRNKLCNSGLSAVSGGVLLSFAA